MEIKGKSEHYSGLGGMHQLSKEEIMQARQAKKTQKRQRAERAIQKEKDRFTAGYLRATGVDYIPRFGESPASQLHPGTLNFLEKFKPSVFQAMNRQSRENPSEGRQSVFPSSSITLCSDVSETLKEKDSQL